MAEKINIQVELESKLKEAKGDIEKLKSEKVFNSPGGEKTLTKLNGILQRLSAVDLSKLSGPELTKFLNDFSKLRSLLDSASRSLTTYTKEFEEQQAVVNDALKTLNSKKSIKSDKLKEKKDALQQVNLKGHTYFNKDTGKQVTNIETIIKLFKDGLLEIRGEKGKKAISEESYNKVVESTGIKKYSEASEAYETAKTEVTSQQTIVNAEKAKLEGLPQSGDVHPVTQEVQQHSANAEGLFSDIRNQEDEKQEEEINKTTEAINKQIPTIEKQTSSLGRAFKQFTLYNIAIRAAKTALREAVQTVQELDKSLTEQAMVTGLTRQQTYRLVGQYQELALQCGATTKEIASVATEYMKQGKTIQESLTLTQAAVSAAKVARVSVGDSVNYLTTALNGFRLSAEDAMLVSDKFAAVAAASATDYDELAIALSKVASQANLAGMSIDYTTALLTKGLETTREAPETMGTALKTIIARMRELGDYGETLEGDTDINNVESQLAYVDIALRNTNGELRSTEEVLDELGKKWDSLNKNQQAAIAKALAGTRQQSRLIAMMEDYERVTELQEISQRSAGATAAQAGVYLEGIEASMNKIQVAWEKIIMSVSDSEIIIGMFSFIGDSLDRIGDFLSTDFGIIATLTTISLIGLNIVGNKIIENNLAKEQLALKQQENVAALKKLKTEQLAKLTKSQDAKIAAAALKVTSAEAKLEKAITKQELLQQKIKNGIKVSQKEIQAANYEVLTATNEVNAAEKELSLAIKANGEEGLDYLDTQHKINEQTTSLGGLFGGLAGALSGIVGILGVAFSIFQMIAMVSGLIVKLKDVEYRKTVRNTIATKAQAAAEKIKAAFGMAGSASAIPVAGWVIAAAILATLVGIAIATAVSSANKYEKSAEGTADRINELSNEIYKLNEKANAINNITGSFDKLDNKLIKTNADLKEMSSLLDQAADKLDDDIEEDEDIGYGEGVSEKDYYESLQTDKAKREFLDQVEKNARTKANEKRTEQINKIKNMDASERKKFLSEDVTDAEILQAQDAIYALNNNELYEHIDALKESGKMTSAEASAVESLTQSILENMSAEEAWAYAKDDNGKKVQALVNQLRGLKIEAKNAAGEVVKINVAEALMTDDYALIDQVEAYKDALEELEKLGDQAALDAFKESFKQFETFAEYDDSVLEFIDSVGLSIDELNKLYGSWESLQKAGVEITQEEFEGKFDEYLQLLAVTQGDVLAATEAVFGEYLDDSEDALNAFITAYGDLVQVGILNMGQNMDKVKNSINNFYEKALEWNKMSESDKAEFIQDNADLFGGESGDELLKAFQSGNYEEIERALSENDGLQKQLEQRRKEIAQELLIEEARTGEDRNEAYIAQLKEYEKYLNDTENLFKASLEVRLEQEQAQLDEYRSYLEDQQEALEESLEKRKEAYEKYFESINQEEEDEDYEEQADQLISNLSKLGSSTDASSVKQTKELEKQLEDLEEERLKELRERAQEAVLENMDKEVEEINEKFDKLLESNQALLAAMKGELEDPAQYLSNLISTQVENGATAAQLEDYIGGLQSSYGNILGGADLEDISVREENNQLFLTVNGKEIALDTTNEQNLFTAIMKALREVGVR